MFLEEIHIREHTEVIQLSIGGNIKAFREERGWTQEQLAARMGVDRVSVTHWESGVSVPRMGNIEKLAALFPIGKAARNMVSVSGGLLLLRFPRVA